MTSNLGNAWQRVSETVKIGIECTDLDALHGSYNGEGMLRMFVEWMFVFVLPCHCRTFRGFLCALLRGVCARVAEALRVEALTQERLLKSVNALYEHGTMEKHCLLACLFNCANLPARADLKA